MSEQEKKCCVIGLIGDDIGWSTCIIIYIFLDEATLYLLTDCLSVVMQRRNMRREINHFNDSKGERQVNNWILIHLHDVT